MAARISAVLFWDTFGEVGMLMVDKDDEKDIKVGGRKKRKILRMKWNERAVFVVN